MTYRNCRIYPSLQANGLLVWDELTFGIESEQAFETVGEAQADIDRYFLAGPAIVEDAAGELAGS